MTSNYLKKVLPLLRNADLAEATPMRLVSLARAYVAWYDLVSFVSQDAKYGTAETCRAAIDRLTDVLAARCRQEPDIVSRSRMVRALYALVCGTAFTVDFKKKNVCHEIAGALVESRLRQSGSQLQDKQMEDAAVCNCMTDLLYPCPAPDDEYLLFLRRRIAGWIAGMDRKGCWPGVPSLVAMERINAMNRNSFMLLDKTRDAAIRRASAFYRSCATIPEDIGNFDESYLPMLGSLYELALQGNACGTDPELAGRIARFMYDYSRTLSARNDAWFYCTSHVVRHAAGQLEMQMETERHIA